MIETLILPLSHSITLSLSLKVVLELIVVCALS